MCGIAGQISRDAGVIESRRGSYDAMRDALRRRGPDQDGVYISGNAALIHTRLAVIDIENGRQPMIFERGTRRYILVYNGELYNTDELRGELSALGHRFKTRSDTEVLGEAYLEWGGGCVRRLNGIFAFAVWDEAERRLFMARDRIGVKPLFYAQRGSSLIFASELPALVAHEDIEPVIDSGGVSELLLLGPGRTPGCGVFRGAEELLPGQCAEYELTGRLWKWTYWSLADRECTDSFDTAVDTTRYLVTDAIKRQLVSDVPVCTFLSGGLDSSIISSVADGYLAERGERLRTFSVGYRDNAKYFTAGKFQPNSDEHYIEAMTEYLGAEHFDVTIDTPELAGALFPAVDARGLPGMADVDSSLLLFCREIKRHATVALSGECADEIFGGYPWYRDKSVRAAYGFPWAQSTARRQSFLEPRFAVDGAEYIDSRYRATLMKTHALPGLSKDELRLREMVNLNFMWFMQTLLDRKDRMSMYSGLEVRVPFCDYRIAEYLYSLPWAYKDRGNTEKGLLREAVRGLLPDEVLWRKKSPYPKTHNPEYRRIVSAQLETLLGTDAPLFQIVRRDALRSLLNETDAQPWYGQLMAVPQTIAYFLQLNYWLERFNVRVVV
ncbi:MAG: asparagine synthase (glutamine-hydrolyzing) [Oscillospiraceae bacterium]|jgi:asparagine synthase (glutamine-hydrolysing)|nr:asparagine synthase (glutamine-hydrolyzing) [Oscillospiraceae bacterium]